MQDFGEICRTLLYINKIHNLQNSNYSGGIIVNIYVLLKRTFDTEEKITLSNGKINEDGAEFIINPYDEYAVEEAIQVRDAQGGEVTVISVGTEEAEKQLRTALAMGADKAVLINIEDDIENGDQFTTAKIIGEYLKDKNADLIIAGNVAIDGGSGQVGPRVAEILGIPYITTITKLDIENGNVSVIRDVEGDSETIEASLPLLVTAQQGLNEPRYPSLPGIMKAKKKPLEELELDDLDLEEDDVEAKTKTIEIYLPAKKEAGKVLDGEISAQVTELVQLLRSEAKVI
jgi:electron transfer flavoprotein beta subunit